MVLARLGGDNVTTGPPYAAPWRLLVHSPSIGEGRFLPSSPTARGHTGAEGPAQLHDLCLYAQLHCIGWLWVPQKLQVCQERTVTPLFLPWTL